MTDTIDYSQYVDSAMRGVVRSVLRDVERTGLSGPHHFFISFRTDAPGVMMSETLRAKYPREITIVLQHQFWDLHVEEDHFRVALSFNNIPEKLVIPFAALIGFADPSTKFGLQFSAVDSTTADAISPASVNAAAVPSLLPAAVGDEVRESAQIIALDAFRKK